MHCKMKKKNKQFCFKKHKKQKKMEQACKTSKEKHRKKKKPASLGSLNRRGIRTVGRFSSAREGTCGRYPATHASDRKFMFG